MSGLLLHSSSTASALFGMGKLKEKPRNHNSILSSKKPMRGTLSYLRLGCNNSRNGVTAFFFNPAEDPVLKEALKDHRYSGIIVHGGMVPPPGIDIRTSDGTIGFGYTRKNHGEPVAFAGGLFAGLLRLDLNEDPLKEWVKRAVESAGITEENDTQASVAEDGPTEIEIE